MRVKPTHLPGNLIFAVCAIFLRRLDIDDKPFTVTRLAEWVTDQGYPTTREGIYRIVNIGIDRGYVVLSPPTSQRLRDRLLSRFPNAGDVRVIDVKKPDDVVGHLASEAAALIVELIKQIGAERNPRGTPARKLRPVRLGFGGGGTSLQTAERTAQRLAAEPRLPPIVIHALTSGFDINRPLSAPSAFLTLFQHLNDVSSIGLFSAPLVDAETFEEQKGWAGFHEAFDRAGEIDIVVTSLARADDDDGMLNYFFDLYGVDGERERLRERGLRGDVLWQPFTDDGPLEDTSIRAVTLFDIPQLVELAATPGKHVIAVAGPCVECGKTKEPALLPLLKQRNLRVFNHLVTDSCTIEELIREEPAA